LSCDHHTSLVTDFVMSRNDNAYTIAVFTDISKAFESVPHHELVDTIWNSDIPSLQMSSNFFHRKQVLQSGAS